MKAVHQKIFIILGIIILLLAGNFLFLVVSQKTTPQIPISNDKGSVLVLERLSPGFPSNHLKFVIPSYIVSKNQTKVLALEKVINSLNSPPSGVQVCRSQTASKCMQAGFGDW